MALRLNDRVLETTTSTGTTSIELSNQAPSGFVTFQSGVSHNNSTYYAIVHQITDEWEVGYGVFASGDDAFPAQGDAPVLTRTSIIASSNSNSAVSFTAGTKDVFVTYPAAQSIFLDQNGNLAIGSGLGGIVSNTKYRVIADGDIRASGVNAGSGIVIESLSSPPSTGNLTERLYNVDGTLYWEDEVLSSTSNLFNISASSGVGHIPIAMGSGINIVGGTNIVTSLQDGGNGSGVITIDAPNIGTELYISADHVPASGTHGYLPTGTYTDRSLEISIGSGILFRGGTNIETMLTDEGTGSGIITINATNNYTAGTGLLLGGPSGVEFNAVPASIANSGIVKLSNIVTSDSGVAITPYGVQQVISSGTMNYLQIGAHNTHGADNGTGKFTLANASGILLSGGNNISVSLHDSDGSGIFKIDAIGVAEGVAGTGIKIDSSDNSINLDVEKLPSGCFSPNGAPEDNDKIIIYDEDTNGIYKITVSGLAANGSFAGSDKYKMVQTNNDAGYNFVKSHGGQVTAAGQEDRLKLIAGTGVSLDIDIPNDAIRFSTSGLGLGAQDGIEPTNITLGSGLYFAAGAGMQIVLSKSNGSGVLTFDASAAGSTTASGNAFKTIDVNDADSGFSWGADDVGASGDAETLKLVAGKGIELASDSENRAIRITAPSGVDFAATGTMSRLFIGAQDGDTGSLLHQLNDGSGIYFAAGNAAINVVLSDTDSGSGVVTISHADTSSQASVDNSGNDFIQDIVLDEWGHITSIVSASASASAGGGGAAASGLNGQVQYNNNGFLGGASGLYYDDTTSRIGIGTSSPRTALHIVGTGLGSSIPNGDSQNPKPRPEWPSNANYLQGGLTIENTYFGTDSVQNQRGGFITPYYGGGLIISSLRNSDQILIGPSGVNGIIIDGERSEAVAEEIPRISLTGSSRTSAVNINNSLSVSVSGAAGKGTRTLGETQNVVLFDTKHLSESGTINLPEAASAVAGRVYTIKRMGMSPSGVRIIPGGSSKIDNDKTEETLWVEGDCVTYICATGTDGSYGWHSTHKSFKPHSALVRSTIEQRIGEFKRTQILFNDVSQSSPSGMVEFNSDSDGVENLSNPSSYDDIPYHDSYYGTMTEGFGSGIRVRRDGWYRGWGKVCVGRRFKHRDNLTLIISKYNKNQDKLIEVARTIEHIYGSGSGDSTWTTVDGIFYAKAGDFLVLTTFSDHDASDENITNNRRYMSNTWSNNSFLSVQEIQDPNETTSMVSDDDRPEG